MKTYTLNFLVCALGKIYEDMAIPFMFFALLNNPNSHVEIIVLDKNKFINDYKIEINMVANILGAKHFRIRNLQNPLNKNIKNTYRFFDIPIITSKYTYILDIDIMILENILSEYLKIWPLNNKIYCNIVRTNSYEPNLRLTGVHMVNTKLYYTDKLKKV